MLLEREKDQINKNIKIMNHISIPSFTCNTQHMLTINNVIYFTVQCYMQHRTAPSNVTSIQRSNYGNSQQEVETHILMRTLTVSKADTMSYSVFGTLTAKCCKNHLLASSGLSVCMEQLENNCMNFHNSAILMDCHHITIFIKTRQQ